MVYPAVFANSSVGAVHAGDFDLNSYSALNCDRSDRTRSIPVAGIGFEILSYAVAYYWALRDDGGD